MLAFFQNLPYTDRVSGQRPELEGRSLKSKRLKFHTDFSRRQACRFEWSFQVSIDARMSCHKGFSLLILTPLLELDLTGLKRPLK